MSVPDLAFINWSASGIAREADAAIVAREAALSSIKEIPADGRTFANTLAALERAGEPFGQLEQTLQLLMNVHPNTDIREAAQEASARMDEADIRMEHDRELYDAVMAWERTGELKRLDGPDRKLADDMLRDLKRIGFGLPDEQFEELKRNRAALKRLEDSFEKAINDWDDGILVTEQQLDGLPEHYRDGLTRSDDGRFRVSLKYPDIHPFMRLAHDDGARRELAAMNLRKGGEENLKRLAEMIHLRQRNAHCAQKRSAGPSAPYPHRIP
jgi:thimet oligopeptidase